MRNRVFPAISINQDVTALSDSNSGRQIPSNQTAIKLQTLPMVSTEELRIFLKKTAGYWPQIAEMHMKGKTSVSSDPCIFPHTEKC